MKTNFGRSVGVPDLFDRLANEFESRTALHRIGSAEEIANLVSFLVSNDAINMTGAIVVSDGGLVINECRSSVQNR